MACTPLAVTEWRAAAVRTIRVRERPVQRQQRAAPQASGGQAQPGGGDILEGAWQPLPHLADHVRGGDAHVAQLELAVPRAVQRGQGATKRHAGRCARNHEHGGALGRARGVSHPRHGKKEVRGRAVGDEGFHPLTRKQSSSRVAVVRGPSRVSVKAKDAASAPRSTGGRKRSRCSALP